MPVPFDVAVCVMPVSTFFAVMEIPGIPLPPVSETVPPI